MIRKIEYIFMICHVLPLLKGEARKRWVIGLNPFKGF